MGRLVMAPGFWLVVAWFWMGVGGGAAAAPAEEGVQGLRVAVLPVVFEGGSPMACERIEAGLLEGLGRGEIEAIPSAEVTSMAPEAAGCSSPGCYRSVAQKTSASHVFRGTVASAEREYRITLELFDGVDGEVLATSTDSCEICGLVEVAELAADRAASLHDKLAVSPAGPGMLAIRSAPEGAVVSVDGREVGSTPVEVRLTPGAHTLLIRKDGYTTLERSVSSVDGVREIVTFELREAPDTARRTSLWGWLAVGTGVAVTAAGATMIGIHHKPYRATCDGKEDESGLCPLRYNTLAGGITLAAVGVAAITTGVVLVVRARKLGQGRRRGQRAASRLRPAASGLALVF